MRLLGWAGADHFHQDRTGKSRRDVRHGGFRHGSGEMRDQADIMRFAQRGNLLVFSDAADVGDGDARVVDQALLDQFVDVPLVAELLAHSDRHFDVRAQLAVDVGILGAQQVFAEVGFERLDERAQADGVGEVEAGVVVDGPVARVAYAGANFGALAVRLAHHLVGVEGCAISRIGDGSAKRAESGFDAGPRGVPEAALVREASRVAFDVVARLAAQQLIYGHAERLAFDIPQGHVECSQRMQLFAARRIEAAAIDELPQVVDARRVVADQHLGALGDGIARTAFADAGNSLIGLHGDDVETLVEHRARSRIVIKADARDLHFRDVGVEKRGTSERHGGAGGERREKRSAVHGRHDSRVGASEFGGLGMGATRARCVRHSPSQR